MLFYFSDIWKEDATMLFSRALNSKPISAFESETKTFESFENVAWKLHVACQFSFLFWRVHFKLGESPEKALVFVLFLRFWKNRWYICSQKCFLLLAFSQGKLYSTEKLECFSKIQLQFSPHSFLTFWISILKVFFMTSYL